MSRSEGAQVRRSATSRHVDAVLESLGADGPTRAVFRVSPEASRLLRSYAEHVTLNVEWYTHAKRSAYAAYQRWRLAAGLGGLSGIALLAAAPLVTDAEVGLQLGVIVTTLLGTLRLLSTTGRHHERFAHFWQTLSRLRERQYAFLSQWDDCPVAEARPPLLEGGEPSSTFLTALKIEILEAQRIEREEKQRFFDRMMSLKESTDLENERRALDRPRSTEAVSRDLERAQREITATDQVLRGLLDLSTSGLDVDAELRVRRLERLEVEAQLSRCEQVLSQALSRV